MMIAIQSRANRAVRSCGGSPQAHRLKSCQILGSWPPPYDLPPLWDTPEPYRGTRNGGPPLEPRSAGRPTIDTPELRDRIFELLCDGMPLRAICRVEGMPARRTVYNWKARDPEFDRQLSFAAQEGCIRLVETISEQFERIVQTHPPKVARRTITRDRARGFKMTRKLAARP
jgi:hypothetical protein